MTTIHFVRHGLVHNPQRVLYARLPRFIRRMRRKYPDSEVVAVTHRHITPWMHLWTRGLPFTLETQAMIDPFPETASVPR